MIVTNTYGDGGPWGQMRHADWNGLTITDLVFPTFLFVMGTSIAFAFKKRLTSGASRTEMAWHATRRAGSLVALGLFLNVFPSFDRNHFRVYGTLQRIALCYLVVALFYLWDNRVSTQVVALTAILVGYWVVLRWVPVPGAGIPGRDIPFLDRALNLPGWLDRHIFPHHLYEDAITHNLNDPEGLLSTIPAVGTTILGLLAGRWLLMQRSLKAKTQGLIAGATVCLVLGYIWSAGFPLNKKLWTSSFVLVSAGWSLTFLALAYSAVEWRGWCKNGLGKWLLWPWLVFGSNAIAAYMASELLLDPGLFREIHHAIIGQMSGQYAPVHIQNLLSPGHTGWGAFVHSIACTAICFVPMWTLHRKRIFLRL